MSDLLISRFGVVESRHLRPSPTAIVLFLPFAIAWYFLFLGFGLNVATGWFGWSLLLPAAILGANATLRFVPKWTELRADQLGVVEPVGRRNNKILLRVFLTSAVAGAIAGYLVGLTPGWTTTGLPAYAASMACAGWESLMAVKRRFGDADPELIKKLVVPSDA